MVTSYVARVSAFRITGKSSWNVKIIPCKRRIPTSTDSSAPEIRFKCHPNRRFLCGNQERPGLNRLQCLHTKGGVGCCTRQVMRLSQLAAYYIIRALAGPQAIPPLISSGSSREPTETSGLATTAVAPKTRCRAAEQLYQHLHRPREVSTGQRVLPTHPSNPTRTHVMRMEDLQRRYDRPVLMRAAAALIWDTRLSWVENLIMRPCPGNIHLNEAFTRGGRRHRDTKRSNTQTVDAHRTPHL